MGNKHTVTKRKVKNQTIIPTENDTKESSYISSTNISKINPPVFNINEKSNWVVIEKAKIESSQFPHTFTWDDGGNEVYLSGTFCNWEKNHKMTKINQKEFKIKIDLPDKGVIQYKFFVDGVWRYTDNEPICTDGKGNINNILDINQKKLSLEKYSSDLEKVKNVCLQKRIFPDMYKSLNLIHKVQRKSDYLLNNYNKNIRPKYPNVFNGHLLVNSFKIKHSKYEKLSTCFRLREKQICFIYYKPKKNV